ncbi:unnamed protein product [Lactuca virosa]|uniref:AP2/ERF domain-containing protein n=1 Tax=Lactuca virosa TaxID=75947 RepID=A0AAU9M136_9ASTR|nr:unnamed protein product [Lactuca virosa]
MDTSSSAGSSRRTTRKHPTFHGIRERNEKWVVEIREPGTNSRIWVGTYPTAEMAAIAYDVVALALKGGDATLNFPNFLGSYQVPESSDPELIKSAAREAATSLKLFREAEDNQKEQSGGNEEGPKNYEFVDEEEIFNMSDLARHMAEGLQISPPSQPKFVDSSPENSSGHDNLWSY